MERRRLELRELGRDRRVEARSEGRRRRRRLNQRNKETRIFDIRRARKWKDEVGMTLEMYKYQNYLFNHKMPSHSGLGGLDERRIVE